MSEADRPKVGVAAIIHDGKGNIVMGKRAASHGAGMSILFLSPISTPLPPSTLLPTISSPTLTPHTGTMQCPGGHLEYGESFAQTAMREVQEETGLEVGNVKFLTATNDVFGEGKHYITIFVTCEIVGKERVPQVSCYIPFSCISASANIEPQPMEPHKCAAWEWHSWTQMWAWAGEQAAAEKAGTEVKIPMFLPLVNLWKEYPEMANALEKLSS